MYSFVLLGYTSTIWNCPPKAPDHCLGGSRGTEPNEKAHTTPFSASFRQVIGAAVNETIVGLLGVDVSESFFAHLRDEMGIPRDMIAQRLEMLFLSLDRIFGIGSRTVGRAIIKNLYRTLGLKFAENPSYNLSDYVEEALFDFVTEIVALSEPKLFLRKTERLGELGS